VRPKSSRSCRSISTIAELVARGHGPEEAAHIARTEFSGARLEALLGSLRQAHCHEPPPPGPAHAFSLDSLATDLRHALRALVATPSFLGILSLPPQPDIANMVNAVTGASTWRRVRLILS
jgi:hypothetical protein